MCKQLPVMSATPTPKPNAASAPRVIPRDDEPFYIVQLAAFRDAGKAVEQAGMMSQKHTSRLNGATLGTMKVDTGEEWGLLAGGKRAIAAR